MNTSKIQTQYPQVKLEAMDYKNNIEFIKHVADELVTYLQENTDPAQPTIRFTSEDELKSVFEKAGVSLHLSDNVMPVSQSVLREAARLTQHYSVRTGSPFFNNQLYGTPDVVGVAGDWISSALNANSHTYEVSPVFTTMEREILSKLARIIGGRYVKNSAGVGGYDGLTLPGGSVCNQYAMHVARFKAVPDIKSKGLVSALQGKNLVAYVSAEAHYSYLKAVNMLGIGTDNLVKVPSGDVAGAMCPNKLEGAIKATIAQGDLPFFVGATAGTTVLGTFDPFDAIANICERYGLWMHVDASWGGGAFVSQDPTTRAVMKGANRADSVCWNPHKSVGAPLQCSLFLIAYAEDEYNLLKKANGAAASYLFQPDKNFSNLDMGDKTLHCGRKSDALKIWLMWKSLGDKGIGQRVDYLIGLIHYMSSAIADKVDDKGRYCFVQVAPVSYANLCFYVIPPSLREEGKRFNPYEATADEMAFLKTVAPTIKSRMQKGGLAMIGFQPIGELPNCWRMVAAGAKEHSYTTSNIDEIIVSMVELCNDL
eukprot:CFRG1144T1